ncbi:lipase [Bacillus sp. J14TS2]|uniref:SGNH/GDSL hydrolase family protein n=1 Tax=Bacillus sp. J14TS2 TaxID=2807188 RepID=UPI001B15B394|nr:SGNH/GDSL hydrolase family protein [Bacillus sp. J14TS2]GIN71513.1 lipase [Bacillus sp. J14TS2]
MKLEKGCKLVMIGDSITDCGRKHPYGEGLFEGVGKGYVALVDALLQASYPELAIRCINMGNSGNTVRDLKERWKTDVVDLQPDWLSIMIGINDVWRHFDEPNITESHISLREYETTLLELVEQVKPDGKGLVLMTPFLIEANADDAMRKKMDEYGLAVKRVAEQVEAIFVDIQGAFNKLLDYYYSATFAADRVHPNMTGHMAIARAFLNAVDYDWARNR